MPLLLLVVVVKPPSSYSSNLTLSATQCLRIVVLLVSNRADQYHTLSAVVLIGDRYPPCKLFTQQTTCKAPFNWASNCQSWKSLPKLLLVPSQIQQAISFLACNHKAFEGLYSTIRQMGRKVHMTSAYHRVSTTGFAYHRVSTTEFGIW